jgi:penicillin amidase
MNCLIRPNRTTDPTAGKIDWDSMADDFKESLLAYAEGVNAFINAKDRKLPVEFSLIRHQPEPWQPVDSTAFMRVMIWQLSHAWYGEVVRAQVIQAVGEKAAAELEIDYPAENPLTLSDGIEVNQLNFNVTRSTAHSPFLSRSLGSNAWAVAGQKSETGMPYLCNDMHLPLSLPGLWYHNHLISGDYHVSGVSLPGVAGVLVGHNAHIAWGMTLAFTDCEDLFVEKFDPDAPTRYQIETGRQVAQIPQDQLLWEA